MRAALQRRPAEATGWVARGRIWRSLTQRVCLLGLRFSHCTRLTSLREICSSGEERQQQGVTRKTAEQTQLCSSQNESNPGTPTHPGVALEISNGEIDALPAILEILGGTRGQVVLLGTPTLQGAVVQGPLAARLAPTPPVATPPCLPPATDPPNSLTATATAAAAALPASTHPHNVSDAEHNIGNAVC